MLISPADSVTNSLVGNVMGEKYFDTGRHKEANGKLNAVLFNTGFINTLHATVSIVKNPY